PPRGPGEHSRPVAAAPAEPIRYPSTSQPVPQCSLPHASIEQWAAPAPSRRRGAPPRAPEHQRAAPDAPGQQRATPGTAEHQRPTRDPAHPGRGSTRSGTTTAGPVPATTAARTAGARSGREYLGPTTERPVGQERSATGWWDTDTTAATTGHGRRRTGVDGPGRRITGDPPARGAGPRGFPLRRRRIPTGRTRTGDRGALRVHQQGTGSVRL